MEEKMIIDSAEVAEEIPMVEVPKEEKKKSKKQLPEAPTKELEGESQLESCLRREIVRVQYVPKERTGIENKQHPFYGGLAFGAKISFCVPTLRNSKTLVDPLTKSEKDFLEDYMGLEPNALSVHKKREENFWTNRIVTVGKEGITLDLSDPMQYINYKILLANKDMIAPSMEALRDEPLETYKFVLVSESEVFSETANKVNIKSRCWKEYGKVENDFDVLRTIVETMEAKPVSSNSKIEFLQEQAVGLIESEPRRFFAVITDDKLRIKVLIRKAVEAGVIDRRGDYYYFQGNPLCGRNEEPTLTVAANYLSNSRNQELKFNIEDKLKA